MQSCTQPMRARTPPHYFSFSLIYRSYSIRGRYWSLVSPNRWHLFMTPWVGWRAIVPKKDVFTKIRKRSLLLDDPALWEGVALVELEARVEDIVREPDRGEGVQQPFVKVIRHSSAILDLVKTDKYHEVCAKNAYLPGNVLQYIKYSIHHICVETRLTKTKLSD